MKDLLRYGLAVVGFIVLSFFTKRFLTWTLGPIYFMLVLEALPRSYRRLRGLLTGRLRPAGRAAGS